MTALNLWPLLCGLWKKIVFHVLKELGLTHIEGLAVGIDRYGS